MQKLIRAYGKSELASLYYPHCTSSWARRLMAQDLERYPGLMDRLRQQGWNPTSRLLRPHWVRTIFDAIGEP